jgi:predicted phage-related endonuclease
MLVEVVDRFWHDHVLTEKPPAADAHEATARALALAYPEPVEGASVPLDDVADAIAARADAMERMSAAKFDKAKAENVIKAALGDAEMGTVEGEVVLTWKQQTRAETVQKASTFRVLRSTGKKEA